MIQVQAEQRLGFPLWVAAAVLVGWWLLTRT